MDFVLYQADDGKTRLEIQLDHETVWLSQRQMADLFDKVTDTIGLHRRNIYKEGKLAREGTTEDSSVVQDEGGLQVRRSGDGSGIPKRPRRHLPDLRRRGAVSRYRRKGGQPALFHRARITPSTTATRGLAPLSSSHFLLQTGLSTALTVRRGDS